MSVYYIASVSSGGSTGNTGLSIGSPWPLSKLNTFENAGDTILINKGDTLSSTITLSRSGTSGNPITYDIYGSATNNAVIDGGASTTNKSLNITGAFIVINNLSIQNSFVFASGTLYITGTHDVTINNCHVKQGFRGIHVHSCTGNIVINGCYVETISNVNGASTAGPANGDGALIQFDTCTGAGQSITNNKCYTASPGPGVGDIISLYISSGTSGSYIQVTGNQVQGGSTGGNGYCGIGMGDNGGQYQFVNNNLIANSGWAGAQIAGGSFIDFSHNKIYGARFTFPQGGVGTLDGIGVFSTGTPPTNITAGNNNINWTNYSSGNINNLYLETTPTLVATPTNWSTNTANTTADPLAPSTIVSNPLFSSGDWNVVVIPVFNYSPSTNVFIVGTTITNLTPNITSQYYPITSYSISPSLPTGLSFSTSTGIISGTPSVTSSNTVYTITATNLAGSSTTTANIAVNASLGTLMRRKCFLI